MGAFVQSSSVYVLLGVLCVGAGCQERLAPIEGTSLRVEMLEVDLGKESARLAPKERTLSFTVRAFDADGAFETGVSGSLDVYLHYQGSRTIPVNLETEPGLPPRWHMLERPLATVEMVAGVAENVSVTLPPVYGPTLLWVEHHTDTADVDALKKTHALGTSETIWFEDPTLRTLSSPISEEGGIEVFYRSRMMDKQAVISGSRHGAKGRLVVTATYQDGYTVSDVLCQDASGTPPCSAAEYDHAFVFSFGRGEYEEGGDVEVGQTLRRLSGPVAEFNGLMEINFPRAHVLSAAPRLELLPDPVLIQAEWFAEPIKLEQQEGALVAGEGTVCEVSDDDVDRGQFSLDVGAGCGFGKSLVVVHGVTARTFQPTTFEGKKVRAVGTLRPVQTFANASGRFFQIWITHPRDAADIEALP